MKKTFRAEIYLCMINSGIVPIFYHDDLAQCKKMIEAAHDAGFTAFEFVNRGRYAYGYFSELREMIDKKFPDMMFGIGSIVDDPTAALFVQAGADFVISPIFNEKISLLCNRRKTAYIPGCSTLTEISNAEEMGADLVKIFPASALGPEFVKSIKGPSPWSNVMVTGGVTLSDESLRQWFATGVSCVGVSASTIWSDITERSVKSLVIEGKELVGRVRALQQSFR